MSKFDICIISASNTLQAKIFTALIKKRKERDLYPREIIFKVYPDPENGRIGSGGGTIWVLRKLLEEEGIESEHVENYFSQKKILIIHAGGESRRLPCYAPEGKLFAPVPAASSSITPPVALDILLSLYFSYPWDKGEVLVSSGDVIIDFDPEYFIKPDSHIFGFTKPASLKQGSGHGVYKFDRYRETVIDFYQKKDVDFLRKNATLEGTDECALDIGIISMNPVFLSGLIEISRTNFGSSTSLYQRLKEGTVYIDLYLELLTACIKNLSFDQYVRKLDGNTLLKEKELKVLFDSLKDFNLGGIVTRNTEFLHLGSLAEYPGSCRMIVQNLLHPFYCQLTEELVSFVSQETVLFNCQKSVVGDPTQHSDVFAENLRNAYIEKPLGSNMFIGLTDVQLQKPVPKNICIEERNFNGKRIRLVYSKNDTFKKCEDINELIICGIEATLWLKERNLTVAELWENNSPDLFSARLYCNGDAQFLEGYYYTPDDVDEWKKHFLGSERYSIQDLNLVVSASDRESQRERTRTEQLREKILKGAGFRKIPKMDFEKIFSVQDSQSLITILENTNDPLLFLYRKELINSIITVDKRIENKISFFSSVSLNQRLNRKVKTDQIVWARAPVRLDIAGGWTDTPPYTNREGGVVVNIAVNLNGQPPIQVFIRPTSEFRIIFHSIDLGVTENVHLMNDLLDYADLGSPFSLAKAALVLLLDLHRRRDTQTLEELVRGIGCGVEITLLCAVPKGSGLGTSSILAGTILAALHRFFGMKFSRDELFAQVLEIEQMLTTGGGWQDQIGGIIGGVKYIETKPGMKPQPVIHQLDADLFENPVYLKRMTLYYTGITRLAKNILQDVVSMCNSKSPAYLYTVRYLKELAKEAREAFSLRNYEALAETVKKSWQANKLIHYSTTNEEIEKVLANLSPFYSGMKLFGAGGGGFGLFLSPTSEKKDELKKILQEQVGNDRARILDFSINKDGLVVTVS